MRAYGKVAVAVVREYHKSRCADLKASWEHQITTLMGPGKGKGCPKSAFLGLCEAGRIRDIDAGNYGAPHDSPNTHYAIVAADMILSGQRFTTKEAFWQCIRAHVSARGIEPAKREQGILAMVEDLHAANYLKCISSDWI